MLTAPVHEIHLSTGKTLPLRATTAQKSGNRYWGILQQLKSGERKFASYGVNVPEAMTGSPVDIQSIKVPAVEGGVLRDDLTVNVEHDHNEKGKARATADREFTGSDGERWTFSFRATLTADGIVNVKSSINRKSGGFGGPRVQTEL